MSNSVTLDPIYYTHILSGQSAAILVSFRTQSLNWRVCLARGIFQYSFRVSRTLVKRTKWNQENKHFHAYFLFISFRDL